MPGRRNAPRRCTRTTYTQIFPSIDDGHSPEDDGDNEATAAGNQTVPPESPGTTYHTYSPSADDREKTIDNSSDSNSEENESSEDDNSTVEDSIVVRLGEPDDEKASDAKERSEESVKVPIRSPRFPSGAISHTKKSRIVTLGTERARKALAARLTRDSRAIRRIAPEGAPVAPQTRQSLRPKLTRPHTQSSDVSSKQQSHKRRSPSRDESQSRPSRKRPRTSERRRPSAETETEAIRITEPEVKQESDNDSDIQIVDERPAPRKDPNNKPVSESTSSSAQASVEFLKTFIAAGKLDTIARLAVPSNREGNIKDFRKHLVLADCRDLDEAVADITDNDNAKPRLMAAEHLSEVLIRRLS